jgi:hypothetical protein
VINAILSVILAPLRIFGVRIKRRSRKKGQPKQVFAKGQSMDGNVQSAVANGA